MTLRWHSSTLRQGRPELKLTWPLIHPSRQNNMEQTLHNTDYILILQPGVRGWVGQSMTALCRTRILWAQIWAINLISLSNPASQIIKLGSFYPSYWISRLLTQLFIRNTVTLSNRTLLAEDLFYPSKGHASGSQSPDGLIHLLLSGLWGLHQRVKEYTRNPLY